MNIIIWLALAWYCTVNTMQTTELSLEETVTQWLEIECKSLSEKEQGLLVNFIYYYNQATIFEKLIRKHHFTIVDDTTFHYSHNDSKDINTKKLVEITKRLQLFSTYKDSIYKTVQLLEDYIYEQGSDDLIKAIDHFSIIGQNQLTFYMKTVAPLFTTDTLIKKIDNTKESLDDIVIKLETLEYTSYNIIKYVDNVRLLHKYTGTALSDAAYEMFLPEFQFIQDCLSIVIKTSGLLYNALYNHLKTNNPSALIILCNENGFVDLETTKISLPELSMLIDEYTYQS